MTSSTSSRLSDTASYSGASVDSGPELIGYWRGLRAQELLDTTEWRQLTVFELGGAASSLSCRRLSWLSKSGPQLPGIRHPSVAQGNLQDCWLLCVLSVLSMQPGGLAHCVQLSPGTSNTWVLRLYDSSSQTWQQVEFDDKLPCTQGTSQLLFARPTAGIPLAPLIEKGVAKFVGSYADLEGGSPAWAFQALTGHASDKWRFQASTQRWRRYSLARPHWQPPPGTPRCNVRLQQSDELVDGESMFKVLRRAFRAQAAVVVSSLNPVPVGRGQLVEGHACAVVQVEEHERLRRIQLFNPWFDDGLQPAAAFQEASALGCRAGPGEGRAQLPPGFFWMQWPAFQVWFQSVDMWREPPQPKRWHLPGLGGCKAAKGHPPQSDTIWSWTLGMPIERSRVFNLPIDIKALHPLWAKGSRSAG